MHHSSFERPDLQKLSKVLHAQQDQNLRLTTLLSCLRAVAHAPASLNFPSLQQTSQQFSRRRRKSLKIRHNLQLSAGMGEKFDPKACGLLGALRAGRHISTSDPWDSLAISTLL